MFAGTSVRFPRVVIVQTGKGTLFGGLQGVVGMRGAFNRCMSLERFCRKEVVTVGVDESVQLAAERMRLRHVGSVIVTEPNGLVVGVITDRDVVCRVVAERMDPETTPVREVMTEGVAVLKRSDSIDTAVHAMRAAGVRRLPVIDESGGLMGMVTLDDLVVLLTAELGEAVHAVRDNQGP